MTFTQQLKSSCIGAAAAPGAVGGGRNGSRLDAYRTLQMVTTSSLPPAPPHPPTPHSAPPTAGRRRVLPPRRRESVCGLTLLHLQRGASSAPCELTNCNLQRGFISAADPPAVSAQRRSAPISSPREKQLFSACKPRRHPEPTAARSF